MDGPINIGHEALVCCHEQLVSEIAGDPRQMAGVLFQYRFISKATKDKVNELNETREYKARLLVDDIESKIKSFPLLFKQFLAILKKTEVRYTDLIKALEEEYKRIDTKSQCVNSLKEKILQIFQIGEHTEAVKLLSQAVSQAVVLRGVCDSDGKTLLHLACRKNYLNWYPVVQSLVEKHNCDVSVVDEDGNTPLHGAYKCGNKKVVLYLLSLPTCNPDAFNKYEFTVLRMALQNNDISTTRALLATGRVDPRRGSPRGHAYHEVIEMDGTLPQNFNDSALEIVTKCATCIKKSSTSHSNFVVYYLLEILSTTFQNRDYISIEELVESIKEHNIALPENPNEIHNLLIGLSCEFEICGKETGNEYEKKEIRRKAPVNEVPRTRRPLLQYITDQGTALQNNDHKCIHITVCSCFAFWFIFTFVLGVCGAAVYNPFSLISTTNVAQIHQQSIPLIGKLNMNMGHLLRLRVLESHTLPISFYISQQCSAQDSYKIKNVNEIVTVGFSSSVESRKLTEWYFIGNTTVNTIITTQILPTYPIIFCLAFLVIFDDVHKFNDFLQSPSLEEENYLFTECIINMRSQTNTYFLDKESYYFVGLYSEIPTEVGSFTVEFSGSYFEYEFSNSAIICSLNSLDDTICQFSSSRDSLSEDACIVGFIPETDKVQSQVKGATVRFETATLSDSTADMYFFIPFLLCGGLTIVVLLLFCVWWMFHQYRYSRTPIRLEI